MEEVVSDANVTRALKGVQANKGSPGVDGMTVEKLPGYLREHWPALRAKLLEGTYEPAPVLRRTIPKSGGGKRELGIPTVLDRLIQQAILQVLEPIFDPTFSESSYGFRRGRSAHEAMRQAKRYIEEGYGWVVDVDLDKFFDRVHHDILMSRVARRVGDKRLLHLIGAYLRAGVMVEGVVHEREEGTPQGGPLSPLLANILLDEFDRELESRGHRFCRYADDCNIYVRSKRAGERAMASVRAFLEKRLRLKVNEAKSAVARPSERKFLGFSITNHSPWKIRIAPKALESARERIRTLTRRTRGVRLERVIADLNVFLRGWVGYFRLAQTPSVIEDVEKWVRRRLRSLLWKQWKRGHARYRHLVELGLPRWRARRLAGAGSGPWRMARVLNSAIPPAYFVARGLLGLTDLYRQARLAT
jgi:group II intron reverse transcriptase/maturase